MSLFDNESILPGVLTQIESDYSSGYDTSLFGTTDSTIVIGTAFDGPVGKVVEVYSPEYGEYVFGKVFDSKTRREATLVAAIQDAWDRGCRTIYACRVSGKEIFKDYELAIDTNLKLRVSGIFPSNSNKSLSFVFNKDTFDMSIEIFKPSAKATINEKKQGLVESFDSIITNVIDLNGNGISVDSDLTELINAVNNYLYNNVIRLSIVDEKGNDVTLSSIEAKSLKVGDMFPGLYTIGRDANKKGIIADTKINLILDEKPYETFEGIFYKKLSLNTNIAKPLPIYSEKNNIHEILGISAIDQYEFLRVPEKIDDYFLKNNIDYEEVNISDFDLYKRLGSGFAVNSCITVEKKEINGKVKEKVRVKEVVNKETKKTEVADGIYSVLENVPSKYRVLVGAYADQKIKSSLPKSKDFKFAKEKTVNMLNGSIAVSANIDKNDLTEQRKYKLSFVEMTQEEEAKIQTIKEKLYLSKTIRQATSIDFKDIDPKKEYEEGSLFLIKDATDSNFADKQNLLYVYSNKRLVSLHEFNTDEKKDLLKNSLILTEDNVYICNTVVKNIKNEKEVFTSFKEATLTDVDNKEFAVISINNGSFVIAELKKADAGENLKATILGTVDQVLSDEEDKLLTSISRNYNENVIVIKSNQFDFLTIDEIVELLSKDKDFKKILNVKTIDILKSQECISDIKDDVDVKITESFEDKEVLYDTNLLIPFRTDDNFARHLAQHCMYTSLKTSPTHGIIGTKVLLDTSINSINNKIKDLINLKLESSLIAKKGNGSNILDKNNMPYPIGRKISVITGQYSLTTDSNYTTISNMAAGYAGMISCLPVDQSSTCQSITIPDLSYEFTNYQLRLLSGAGYVTIKKSYSKGWVITDGITMASSDSVFKRLSASTISDKIEELIREASEPFIGKQNHLANRNSLRSSIKSKLDSVKNTLISDYDFKIIIDNAAKDLGVINIDYSITPIREIKQINNKITVKES